MGTSGISISEDGISKQNEDLLKLYPSAREIRGYFADLIQLTKPRILVLLIISTLCPMVLALEGKLDGKLLAWALLGGLLISASASVVNCIWDADIDAIMSRTKNRPIPAGRVGAFAASCWSLVLGLSGFIILCVGLNPVAGYTALFGHFFYVFIYTVWLKRITPQNIVIGGAAGAIPPLVGWAGVTGDMSLDALLLFLVIFLWTPPHFWALALIKNDDYTRARVPMLPVVSGEKATVQQMLYYTLSLIPVSIYLVYSNEQLGYFSGILFGLLGLFFVYKVVALLISKDESETIKAKKAWSVFSFSLIYLTMFFVALVVDTLLI